MPLDGDIWNPLRNHAYKLEEVLEIGFGEGGCCYFLQIRAGEVLHFQ